MTEFYKNKQDIIDWLDKYEVKNYTLVPDKDYGYVVDVEGSVDLNNKQLNHLKVKFNHIKGSFQCGNNNLISLKNCPEIIDEHFFCGDNKLTSLEYCPKTIKYSFRCDFNRLTSLKYCPKIIGKNFNCTNNELTSLEFCPKYIKNHFYFRANKIKSLEYCPEYVGLTIVCDENPDLKEIQEIEFFKDFYLEHKKFHIEKLEANLNNILSNDSKIIIKIKL